MSDHPVANGRISASVTVTSPRPTERWAPFVAVELCATQSCEKVGRLDIGFYPEGAANMRVRSGAQVLGVRSLDGIFMIGQAIPIDLEWRGGAYLQVRLNAAEAERLELPFVPTAVRIISGSADVKVKDISVQ